MGLTQPKGWPLSTFERFNRVDAMVVQRPMQFEFDLVANFVVQ